MHAKLAKEPGKNLFLLSEASAQIRRMSVLILMDRLIVLEYLIQFMFSPFLPSMI